MVRILIILTELIKNIINCYGRRVNRYRLIDFIKSNNVILYIL